MAGTPAIGGQSGHRARMWLIMPMIEREVWMGGGTISPSLALTIRRAFEERIRRLFRGRSKRFSRFWEQASLHDLARQWRIKKAFRPLSNFD